MVSPSNLCQDIWPRQYGGGPDAATYVAGMFDRVRRNHRDYEKLKGFQLVEVAVRMPSRQSLAGAAALVSDKSLDTYLKLFRVLKEKVRLYHCTWHRGEDR